MTTLVAKLDTRKLDELIKQAPERAERILAAAALQVQGIAQSLAPVDTGALKNSIAAEKKARFTWWVQDGVEYGIYVELPGVTRNWEGKPFMAPAVEKVRQDFERMITEALFP